MWRVLLAAGLLAIAPAAMAAADITLEAKVTPLGPLLVGHEATIELTFRNLGPDAAPGVGAVSSGYFFIVDASFDLYSVPPHQCTVYYDHFNSAPGEPHILVAAVMAGDMQPGDARTCTLGLYVYPDAKGSEQLTFYADSIMPDPVAENDFVELDLVFSDLSPIRVPAIKILAVMMLAASVGLVAAFALRSSR